MKNASPLRYPGGKWRLGGFFRELISLNFSRTPSYAEAYAGGSSLALTLLFTGLVSEIHINDLDPAIYAFWHSVLTSNSSLVRLIEKTRITPTQWRRQKRIYNAGTRNGKLALGFATFFLNRTNHSGILNGGMIGGKSQRGEWKLDARFNRKELIRRIKRVAKYRDRIHLSNLDAEDFIRNHSGSRNMLIYLDPPYFSAGHSLYMNHYSPGDHTFLRNKIVNLNHKWVVSYDDVPAIRKLYKHQRSRAVELLHSARTAHEGRELMFFSPDLKIPRRGQVNAPALATAD